MRRGRQGLVIQRQQQQQQVGLCRLGVNSCTLGSKCGYGGRGCRHGRLRVSRSVIAFDGKPLLNFPGFRVLGFKGRVGVDGASCLVWMCSRSQFH